jgi:hypothetical protein
VDVLPIVDISDTTMAASGTTKKITSNQILGAGGTATLASATITGDLTVRTNKLTVTNTGVGIGTASPVFALDVIGGDMRMSLNQQFYLYYGSATNYASLRTDNSGNVQVFTGLSSPANRFQIANDGVCTWSEVGGVAGTAMTLNSTGLGVKGTIGSASGDAVIAFGTRGVIVGNQASAIASGSFIDVAIVTSGAGYQGFLSVANTQDISANTRTQTTYSVFGRGTASTITQIATANGSLGGASFTVTTPSNGVIRITNTSGLAATISAQFFGGVSA